jgi:hypothetical protein
MRRALAHHLNVYVDWCDRVPTDTGARVAGAAVLVANRLRLPAGVGIGCAALAGCCVTVALAADLVPARTVARRVASWLA